MPFTAERLIARRRLVIAAWIGVTVVAGVFAARIGGVVQGGADAVPGSESERATRALEHAFGRGTLYQFLVVMRDTTVTTDDPRYVEAAARIERALSELPTVRLVETPWSSDRPELIGEDWHTAIAVVTPRVETFHAAELLTERCGARSHASSGRRRSRSRSPARWRRSTTSTGARRRTCSSQKGRGSRSRSRSCSWCSAHRSRHCCRSCSR